MDIVIVIGIAVVVFGVLALLLSDTRKKEKELETKEENNAPQKVEQTEIKGRFGELEIAGILSRLPPEEYIVLNDVLLPTPYGTTQLDHVVVSAYGIFVIEAKNFNGAIYGGEDKDDWIQYLGGKKYYFRNPLKQNFAHVRAIEQVIHINRRFIIPIVVFTGEAILKVDARETVIQDAELYSWLCSFTQKVFTPKEVERFAKIIDEQIIENDETKRAHVQRVHEMVERKNRELEAGLCPWCDGRLVLRTGKYGSFYGCSNYPRCKFTKNL